MINYIFRCHFTINSQLSWFPFIVRRSIHVLNSLLQINGQISFTIHGLGYWVSFCIYLCIALPHVAMFGNYHMVFPRLLITKLFMTITSYQHWGIVIQWTCERECEQVNMSRWIGSNFLGIFYWHAKYCMTRRNILPHVQGWKIKMDGNNGWTIKMDKNTNKWKDKMDGKKKDEHNMFTTKSYVSIQTLPIHNWKVCVNWNITYSFPRGMFPLGIETLLRARTFSISLNNLFFIWIQSFKPFMSRSILATWRIKWMKKKTYEQNIWTTKSYVSIRTLLVHNQEVCVNPNTTCSSPRGMFPLGIKIIWDLAFSIPFQPIFYLNSIFQISYV